MNLKQKYGHKCWNKVISFSEQDLNVNLKYLKIANADELRAILPNIVTNITYGGKMTDNQDIESIQLYIKQTMKNTHLERGVFWQSLWGDDKFPKSID